jgi:predicted ester cyclase
MTTSENKELVRRLVEEAINERNLDLVDELADGHLARDAKRWIGPFRSSFPDFTMQIVDLIAEGDIVGHFRCSGTHTGEWNGIQATGRRFRDVDEIYIFRVRNGRLTAFVAAEDNLSRLRQLGFDLRPNLASAAPALIEKRKRCASSRRCCFARDAAVRRVRGGRVACRSPDHAKAALTCPGKTAPSRSKRQRG